MYLADAKIAAKEAKVAALYGGGRCGGSEPIQRGAAIGSAAHRGAVTDLGHDRFGDRVTLQVGQRFLGSNGRTSCHAACA